MIQQVLVIHDSAGFSNTSKRMQLLSVKFISLKFVYNIENIYKWEQNNIYQCTCRVIWQDLGIQN